MKIVLSIVAAAVTAALYGSEEYDVVWGARNEAEAMIRYRVIDPSGSPVSNANVTVYYRTDYPRLKEWQEHLQTDVYGKFIARGVLNHRIGVGVDKAGYYYSYDLVELRKTKSSPVIVDGRWQPYGETRTIVLKPYIKPERMDGIKEFTMIPIPEFNVWLPYDLEKASWLPPYGDGAMPDVLLRFASKDGKNRYFDFEDTMEVSFTNNAFGGFYIKEIDDSSELKWDYNADTNHLFSTYIKFINNGSMNDGIKRVLSDKEYMVIRTRTRVDESGRMISAHYAKIVGRWGFGKKMHLQFSSFNSTPNDTNLEDEETYRRSLRRREQERKFRKQRK